MADSKTSNDQPDRFAVGTGRAAEEKTRSDTPGSPGVVAGSPNILPDTGRDAGRAGAERSGGGGAASVEGTIGAVGEMDLAGAPAGTTASAGGQVSGGSSATSQGGGPGGGGALSSGGTGVGTEPASGPQTAASTLAALDDRDPSTGAGGVGGAGGRAGAGSSDAAGDRAKTGAAGEGAGND
ncbi:MAG: hypothetical protein ACRD9R_05920 [Pyrinomonadaceae bacterium]